MVIQQEIGQCNAYICTKTTHYVYNQDSRKNSGNCQNELSESASSIHPSQFAPYSEWK